MQRNDAHSIGQQLLRKVPEITIFFWIIKILCTTVGETATDFLSTNLNLDRRVARRLSFASPRRRRVGTGHGNNERDFLRCNFNHRHLPYRYQKGR